MAKQTAGILGGFNGMVGPVIGYQWRGRWCMRARPRTVHNPRTEAQQAHRMQFRDMVQLAGRLTGALRYGMRQESLNQGLTEGNLFVRTNKDCFTTQGVEYERLALSCGPVAPVAFGPARVDEQGVLRVEFEKNPLRVRASADDRVMVVAYCPELKQLVMAAPVARRSRHVALALPDEWMEREFHVWGFTMDDHQRASECQYIALAASDGEENENLMENNDYEKDNSVYHGRGSMDLGLGAKGVGLSMEGRREDGDADTRGCGAGGSGADHGQR